MKCGLCNQNVQRGELYKDKGLCHVKCIRYYEDTENDYDGD